MTDGLVVVDKPAGCTSHDVVAIARRRLGTRRVGHSGTLDPDATGVLLLGIGRATRLLRFLGTLPKSYEGEVVLGVETTTLDAAGEVSAVHDMGGVRPADVRAAAARFVGEIRQVPPMVSAVKVGGRRLHELAREGRDVERAARPVTVHRLEVEPVPGEALVYRLGVECSAGTYVRTLAADLGVALGGGAHLRSLRRTAIGPHTVADAVALDQLEPAAVRPPSAAVAHLRSVAVDETTAAVVAHGRVLPMGDLGLAPAEADGGPWAVLDPAGRLLAVYQSHRQGTVKPAVVVAS